MQLYPDILSGDAVRDSRQMLLDRDDALKSNFSGSTPPEVKTEDVGCIWFNTEEKQFYGLVQIDEDGSNPVWQRIANFSKFNTMDLGTPAEETLYVDLEGDECELKQDMIVLVEHTILPLENYEITEQGKRITFTTPIPAGLKLELRWFSRTIVGRDGATFVPTIENKVLSFDNDQGLPNPEPIDFKEVETDVVAAGAEQRTLIEAKGTEQINLVETKGTEQVGIVGDAGNAQIQRVSTEGDTQVQNVIDTGDAQVARVIAEGDTQAARVVAEGNTQTANATAQAEAAEASAQAASESETACLEVLNRLGTVIKIKGRVDTLEDLPQEGNLNGDCYLVGSADVEQLQEYYWLDDHWEFLGTANNSLNWGAILGDITKQADLQAELDSCVHKTGNEVIDGTKIFNDNITAPNQLDNTTITNCLTSIPQDIKLVLESDTSLTLKAGSKVYVPNGAGVFEEKIIQSDINYGGGTNRTSLICVKPDGTAMQRLGKTYCYSGDTPPTGYTTFAFWYDTANNVVKFTNNNGSSWEEGYSLPICEALETPTGWTSINQVFNGFGYIGSTIFALPGVEGLIPNGRNTDGSLNNTKFKTTEVQTWNAYTGDSLLRNFTIFWNESLSKFDLGPLGVINDNLVKRYYIQKEEPPVSTTQLWYNPETAVWKCKKSTVWVVCLPLIVFNSTIESGLITSFSPKNTFQAVDKNDTEWVSSQGKPSNRYIDLTLGASGTKYTAPANGRFFIGATGFSGGCDMVNATIGLGYSLVPRSGDGYVRNTVEVSKGDSCVLYYSGTPNVLQFKFIYDEGTR